MGGEQTKWDQSRREKKVAQLREKQRAQEMEGVTFVPVINSTYEVNSSIHTLKEKGSKEYITRITKNQSRQAARCEQERKKRLEKEVEECTFKPHVNKSAPEFVQ